MSPSEGYSKAVDMWSIGVIAAMLLSGESIFASHLHRDRSDFDLQVIRTAAKCDLSELERPSVWYSVGKRPKDLIRNLLVLDESARLTVKQALHHSWFTASEYCTELDKLYLEATRDWKHRPKVFRLVEQLDVERLQPIRNAPSSKLSTIRKSTHVDLFSSPPRQSLPSGRPNTKQLSAFLSPIEKETVSEVLSASIQYASQTPPECKSQNAASTNEDCIGDRNRYADLSVEVEMTEYSQQSPTASDSAPNGSRIDDESIQIISGSPIPQRIKHRLPFEEEDFNEDDVPVAVQRNLSSGGLEHNKTLRLSSTCA